MVGHHLDRPQKNCKREKEKEKERERKRERENII